MDMYKNNAFTRGRWLFYGYVTHTYFGICIVISHVIRAYCVNKYTLRKKHFFYKLNSHKSLSRDISLWYIYTAGKYSII